MTAPASEAMSQPSRSSRPVTASPPAVSKLTIVIPAYNEERTIGDVLVRVAAVRFPVECEILVVDDGSRDRTLEIARASSVDCAAIRVLTKPNGGKGSAVRYGIAHATGDVVVVQDADLEIEPSECVRLLTVLLEDGADVVYGSRFLGKPIEWTSGHLANRALSLLTSLLFLTRVTDMETSHKMVRRQVLSRLSLVSNRFDIEPEITGKLLRLGCRIREVPIAYSPRTRAEGKKIGWRDGLSAVATLWRVRLMPLAALHAAPVADASDPVSAPSNAAGR